MASIELISFARSFADMLVLSFARAIHMSRNCLKISLFTDDKFISRSQLAARPNSFDCRLMMRPLRANQAHGRPILSVRYSTLQLAPVIRQISYRSGNALVHFGLSARNAILYSARRARPRRLVCVLRAHLDALIGALGSVFVDALAPQSFSAHQQVWHRAIEEVD